MKDKVINKKLHPYYKTGVDGWIGEEVDDNDYIICPICGEVLGMNYYDYASEQECYDKCPKCGQQLDYSEIYDFEDTCYFDQLLEIKDYQLALTENALKLVCEELFWQIWGGQKEITKEEYVAHHTNVVIKKAEEMMKSE